jgi:hypothetical protein
MQNRRYGHTASLLPNGKVLVTGGDQDTYTILKRAELYDPTTGNWTNVGNMLMALDFHTASALKDGNVLVSGGNLGGGPITTAELYNSHGIKNP